MLTKISFNNVLPNHSITDPLYLNASGIRRKQQTRFAADPQGVGRVGVGSVEMSEVILRI